jgi:predicted extracellular nuclease
MQVTLAQEIRIVGQNVQNFFYSLDRTRTQDNSTAVSNYTTVEGRTAKLNAIVTALYPYEADIYAFNEVECCEEVMQLLAQRMGELTGKTYDYVKDGLTYDHDDSQNAAGIVKSGFIYNTATISLNGSSYSGSGTNFIYSRQNRFQSFESVTSGERFTLSMNHFKSGSTDTDKQSRATNASNLLGALTGATDPDILVIGDLNGVV